MAPVDVLDPEALHRRHMPLVFHHFPLHKVAAVEPAGWQRECLSSCVASCGCMTSFQSSRTIPLAVSPENSTHCPSQSGLNIDHTFFIVTNPLGVLSLQNFPITLLLLLYCIWQPHHCFNFSLAHLVHQTLNPKY